MRWEALVEDWAARFDAAERAEDRTLAAELTEAEAGRTLLADRLRAQRGAELRVRLRTGETVLGEVLDVAPQWVLLGQAERRVLIPVTAVQAAWPLGPVAPGAGEVERRLGMTHVLRGLAREGARVRVTCDGGMWSGRLTRVGADHLDLRPGTGDPAPVTIALSAVVTVASG